MFAKNISVTAKYLFFVRIPHNELSEWNIANIPLVNVEPLSGSTAGHSESYFAKSTHLAHKRGCFGCRKVKYYISTFVCGANEAFASEFCFEFFAWYWWY